MLDHNRVPDVEVHLQFHNTTNQLEITIMSTLGKHLIPQFTNNTTIRHIYRRCYTESLATVRSIGINYEAHASGNGGVLHLD